MRIAAVYDIHGNLPALEAVLGEVRRATVDLVIVGGDVIPGPLPKECMTCLMDLGTPARFIHGNGESDMLTQYDGRDISHVPEPFREIIRWSGLQLLDDHRRAMANWAATCEVTVDGIGNVLFCHATPRDDREIFTELTVADKLAPVFAEVQSEMVVCGHTHMQFDRTIGGIRVVNAGSVGMPFDTAGAYWLLLGPDVQLMHTTYDLEHAAKVVRSTSYPHAKNFSSINILNPPKRSEMLERLTAAELS